MATVYVTMGKAGAASSAAGPNMPVWTNEARSETITSSGTSAAGSLEANSKEILQVYCETGIYVHVSPAPGTACTATNGRFVKPLIGCDLKMLENDVVTVIDA